MVGFPGIMMVFPSKERFVAGEEEGEVGGEATDGRASDRLPWVPQ